MLLISMENIKDRIKLTLQLISIMAVVDGGIFSLYKYLEVLNSADAVLNMSLTVDIFVIFVFWEWSNTDRIKKLEDALKQRKIYKIANI